jgi:dephospho-CoA kinase
MPQSEKKELADFVIINSGNHEKLFSQIDRILLDSPIKV